MDTSREYIKMCDCLEIKTKPSYDECSFWARPLITGKYSVWMSFHSPGDIFLPRQDQIQKMIIKEKFGDFGTHWDMCIDIPMQFVSKNPTLELSSMEQIWLSCYMLSIHQKIWDGEKWAMK